MQALRLVLIAMVVIAALTIVGKAIPAGTKPIERPVGEPFTEKPEETKVSGGVVKQTIDPKAGKPAELVADVGDTVELKVKLPTFSTLVIPKFGVERDIAPNIETTVTFSVSATGRIPVTISQTGQVLTVISARSAVPGRNTQPDDSGQDNESDSNRSLTPA